MRAVVQRVTSARVDIDDVTVGAIDAGLLVLLAARDGDTTDDLEYVVRKVSELRIFEDDGGKMNHSVEDTGGAILLVSQFTLYGDTRKGRRPSFVKAMHPDQASPMMDAAAAAFAARGIPVQTGRFGADMQVHLVNDGPVTLVIDSSKEF